MQAIEKNGLNRLAEFYNPKHMMQHLDDPKVREVRVFKLVPGMILNVQGMKYKVVAVRPNGKVTMKYKGEIEEKISE